MSRNLERVSSSSTSSSGGRRGPARPCGRVTTRTVIGPCGRAGATSARAGCFFVFGLDFSRACRCCLLCTCDLIYIRVHRSVCAPRHACCVLLRPATDDSGPFAQCAARRGASLLAGFSSQLISCMHCYELPHLHCSCMHCCELPLHHSSSFCTLFMSSAT